MRTTVIDCAKCGAPLGASSAKIEAGDLVPCLYCGALLRFGARVSIDEPTTIVVESTLSNESITRARDAALRGGRAEAISVCVREGGVTEASAALAVDDIIKNVAHKTVFSQSLNAFGWALVLGSLAFIGGGALLLTMSWYLTGAICGALGLLNAVALRSGIATSLRTWTAARGSAFVRHSVCVGPTGFSDGCQVYSLGVDVTPAGSDPPFHARLVVPVRPRSIEKVQAGKVINVRYADGGAWLRSDTQS